MFPSVVVKVIIDYVSNFEFLSWICQNKLNNQKLSVNENAIEYLEQNKNKINWHWLSSNLNAIDLLQLNKDKTSWGYFIRKSKCHTFIGAKHTKY